MIGDSQKMATSAPNLCTRSRANREALYGESQGSGVDTASPAVAHFLPTADGHQEPDRRARGITWH